MFANSVLFVAIVIVLGQCWALRQQVRRGGIVTIPMATFTWIAMVVIIGVLVFGFSPLHLLWLFPLSFFLSVGLGISSTILNLTFSFLSLLAGPIAEPEPAVKKSRKKRKHRRSKKR